VENRCSHAHDIRRRSRDARARQVEGYGPVQSPTRSPCIEQAWPMRAVVWSSTFACADIPGRVSSLMRHVPAKT